jgi:hypothetical protein
MKTVILIILPFLFLFQLQLNAQEVVASGGDYFSNVNGSLGFTIGEPVIETFQGTTKITTQGFQQTRLLIAEVEDFQNSDLNIEAYPNPTHNFLNIRVNNWNNVRIKYKMYDSDGKLLLHDESTSQEFSIPMTRFEPGTYYLRLTTRHEELKTFKIIKN